MNQSLLEILEKRLPWLAGLSPWLRFTKIPEVLQRSMRFLECFFSVLIKLSDWYRDLFQVAQYCRFSLLILLLGVALLFHEQGRELAMRVDSEPWHAVFFVIGVVLWSFQGWFGSRRLLDMRYGRPAVEDRVARFEPEPVGWARWFVRWFVPTLRECVDYLPRWIGLSSYVFALVAFVIALIHKDTKVSPIGICVVIAIVGLGVLFFRGLVTRSKWMTKLPGYDPTADKEGLDYLRRWVGPFTSAYALTFTGMAFLAPTWFGFTVGSLGVMLIAFSAVVPVGSWLVYRTTRVDKPAAHAESALPQTREVSSFPVIGALFAAAVLFSFFNDNHDVRTTGKAPSQVLLAEALKAWMAQAPTDSDGGKPLLVVATAGGGIRAAQWTITVLGGLTDVEPKFRQSVFGISGVSGGSVGAAVYAATVRAHSAKCEASYRQRGASCVEGQSRAALSADFLAPALTRMLFSDLMQRFLVAPVFPDRQRALEYGWEVRWKDVLTNDKTEGLGVPFTSLAATGSGVPWLPLLMLNSTHMETGKRVVASAVKLAPEQFTDTVDLLQLIGEDLPLSTAAGNSARFPYVSPAGTLRCDPARSKQSYCGHVVDGGYFENYGAVTADQLMRAVLSELDRKQNSLRPVFVVISSDPRLSETFDSDEPTHELPHSGGANESLGPPKALLSPRGARGELAVKALRAWVTRCAKHPTHCGWQFEPKYFHFRMDVPKGESEPALGWLMSTESEAQIQRMLTCGGAQSHNRRQYEELLKLLGTETSAVQKGAAVCGASTAAQ